MIEFFHPLDSRLNLKNLLNELADASNKYYEIGIQLNISGEMLKQIEKDYKDTNRRFSEMLSCWLHGNGDNISWDPVISALKSPFVGYKTLAAALEKKYVSSKEITSTLTQGIYIMLHVCHIWASHACATCVCTC